MSASAQTAPSDFVRAKLLRLEQSQATRDALTYAIRFLTEPGGSWGLRELARHLGCDVRTLSDIRDQKRPAYEWAIGGLPPEGQEAFKARFGSRHHLLTG